MASFLFFTVGTTIFGFSVGTRSDRCHHPRSSHSSPLVLLVTLVTLIAPCHTLVKRDCCLLLVYGRVARKCAWELYTCGERHCPKNNMEINQQKSVTLIGPTSYSNEPHRPSVIGYSSVNITGPVLFMAGVKNCFSQYLYIYRFCVCVCGRGCGGVTC